MKLTNISILTLALVLTPMLAEASATPGLNYNSRRVSIDRPTTRTIDARTRMVRLRAASERRGFMRSLRKIEVRKDEIAPEPAALPSPQYRTNLQDFTPYHWNIRRRHVRHQYWDNYYQRGTDAHTGQGLLGQPEFTSSPNHRTDIDQDSGGR